MRDAGARPFYFIDMFYEAEPGAVRDENLPRGHTPSLFLVSPSFPSLNSGESESESFLSLAARVDTENKREIRALVLLFVVIAVDPLIRRRCR